MRQHQGAAKRAGPRPEEQKLAQKSKIYVPGSRADQGQAVREKQQQARALPAQDKELHPQRGGGDPTFSASSLSLWSHPSRPRAPRYIPTPS